MIEIRYCKFPSNNSGDGIGVFEDGKVVYWKELDSLKESPIRLRLNGC